MRPARISAKQLSQFHDPREMPAYGIREAAHYLRIPVATLKSWVLGRDYQTKRSGKQHFESVLVLPDKDVPLLSFYNLAEAHVLSAFRKDYGIGLQNIRSAMEFAANRFGHAHPLIDQEFATDGVTLFIEHLGKTLDASAGGQIVLNFYAYLNRLDRVNNIVARLWPFTRSTTDEASPRSVFIDPRISFGRPTLIKCNVPTCEIADRFQAGETAEALAEDYGCDVADINEGLRCELANRAAA
jgi:uncharacterized protein (DUF433 family)